MQAGFHMRCAVVVAALCAAATSSRAADEVTIRMGVLPGLKFDQSRFAVKPGAKVTLVFHNPDQMIHNIVFTEPGARQEVVMGALALGADGPAKNFVPETKKVLWASKALAPGESTTLTFIAPTKEDVYPYVCTYTGHGFVMFGAMYVTTKPLPPLESDPNVPPPTPTIADMSDHSKHALDRPVVSRTFLPDCGPAAIAVGLPGGMSYVFDAGACRLRYIWKSGFVDNNEHWAGKGDAWGKVVGRVWYRTPAVYPIRMGDVKKTPTVQWRGYAVDKAGYPQLRYLVDGVEVRETAQARTDGIDFTYEISSAPGDVYFVMDTEGGAALTSSVGAFESGVLKLTSQQAKRFTISVTERPGVEPIGYWSMNDHVIPQRDDPPPGVVGRAFEPGAGKKPQKLDSGISTAELRNGGTLMAWVKLAPAAAPTGASKEKAKKTDKKAEKQPEKPAAAKPSDEQPIFSAGDGKALLLSAKTGDDAWHHIAATISGNGATLYVDGVKRGPVDLKLPEADAPIVIGSIGDKTFLKGRLDEVRIFSRVLSEAEIAKIHQREKAASEVRQ